MPNRLIRPLRLAAAVALVGPAVVLATATPAVAAPPSGSCSYDGTSHVVSVTVSADYTVGHFAFIVPESGTIKLYLYDGESDSFQNSSCGATTSEAASIAVTGSSTPDSLQIMPLGPGFGSEATGLAEIEWTVDLGDGVDALTADGNSMAAGTAGINMNYDDDVDVTMTNVEDLGLTARLASTNVTLTAAGGKGTGAARTDDVVLVGGPLNDTLVGGNGPDVLAGGEGNDRLLGGAGNDDLGSLSESELFNDPGRNVYIGGPGGDNFYSGTGYATVSYADRSTPVTVTLNNVNDDGASGEHDNVRADVEAVSGGSAADAISAAAAAAAVDPVSHRFAGGAGADKLTGGPVADVLISNGGKDVLKGLDGPDDLRAGPGNDTLYGGEGIDGLDGEGGTDVCNGGPAADVFEHCEKRS